MSRPVSGEVAKSSRMELRIEPHELDAYKRASQESGKKLSEWIRDILNGNVPMPSQAEIHQQADGTWVSVGDTIEELVMGARAIEVLNQ